MKLSHTILLLAFGVLVLLGVRARAADTSTVPVHRHALLVGVTGYARPGEASAVELDTTPDVKGLAAVLKSRWGFGDSDITILNTPAQTTRASIVAAFRRMVQETQPGDVVYFHFSGHGAQTPDPREVTGYDQTVLPSDYLTDSAGNDISNHDIHTLLEELKARQPASVLLTFDCCHSGVMTRGGRMLVRQYIRSALARSAPDVPAQPAQPTRGSFITSLDAAGLGYTVISACRNDEVDTETDDDAHPPHAMGSLSYALVQALQDSNTDTTYRDLLYRVESTMLAKGVDEQEPQMDGNPDQALFSGKIEHPSPSILVEVVSADDSGGPNKPVLEAGSLMGIAKGTKLAIYPRDTKTFDTAKPIATAEVTDAGSTDSDLNVTYMPGYKLADLGAARAIITARRYMADPLGVDIAGVADATRKQAIASALQPLVDSGTITLRQSAAGSSASFDLWVGPPLPSRQANTMVSPVASPSGVASAGIVIERSDGSFLTVQNDAREYVQLLSADSDLADEIATAIQREARLRVLHNLERQDQDSANTVEMRIIPCSVKAVTDPHTGKTMLKYDRDLTDKDIPGLSGANPRLPAGTHFRVALRNRGELTEYITVLDIRSDGTVGPFWPDSRIATTANTLEGGGDGAPWIPIYMADGKTYQTWHMTEPLGQETYLVLATQKPADFSPLIDEASRGIPESPPAREAMQTPLGQLLANVMAGTRDPDNMDVGDWAAFPVTFTVTASSGAVAPH